MRQSVFCRSVGMAIIFYLSAGVLSDVNGAEPADSISDRQLSEVTVEADRQRNTVASTVYIPAAQDRKAAQNAIDLLKMMNITQINVDVVNKTVSDNFGEGVTIFINYLESRQEDLDGMRTSDVRKIEYLEYPSDPRFRGAKKVLNFIMQEYAYGGYTKLSDELHTLSGLYNYGTVFSKFTFGRMTYDLYAGSRYNSNHIGGEAHTTDYIISPSAGAPSVSVTRMETADMSRYRRHAVPVTFRASYNTESVKVSNTLWYSFVNTPYDSLAGRLLYFPSVADREYGFGRCQTSRVSSAGYAGSIFLKMPHDFSLDVTPTFVYSRNKEGMFYHAGSIETPVIRNVKEDSYYVRADVNLRKQIGEKHNVMLGGTIGNQLNHVIYYGSADFRDRFHQTFASGEVGYRFSLEKMTLNFDGGIMWEGSKINGIVHDDVYPYTHLYARYSPTGKHALNFYFQYATNSPDASQKTPDIMQENEFMWIGGDPHVRPSRHTTFNVSYTWLPSNIFSLSAYAQNFALYDRLTTTYVPYDSGRGILRTYTNDGDYVNTLVGLQARLTLLGGALQLSASPRVNFTRISGIMRRSYTPVNFYGSATYYIRGFYAQLYYSSPQRALWNDSNMLYRSRNDYSLNIGWSCHAWNMRLIANNIFSRCDVAGTAEIITPNFRDRFDYLGNRYRQSVGVSVTYTLGYGKKIDRNNEIGAQSGGASAIIR